MATIAPAPKRPDSRRRLRFWAITILVLVASPFVYFFYHQWLAHLDLSSAIEELDRIDPGWRLRDMEAKRVVPLDEKNSALMVAAIHRSMPKSWMKLQLYREIDDIAPPVRLSSSLADRLRKDLKPLAGMVLQVRKLVEFPSGSYGVSYLNNHIYTFVSAQDCVREVGEMLYVDCWSCIEEGRAEDAFANCHALLNVGRSVGDDPSRICLYLRLNQIHRTVRSLERALAQGTVKPGSLSQLQKALLSEAGENLLLVAMRGERAIYDVTFSSVESRKTPLSSIAPAKSGSIWDELPDYFAVARVKHSHAFMLRWYTQAVEACKLAGDDRIVAFQKLKEESEPILRNPEDHRSLGFAIGLLGLAAHAGDLESRSDAPLVCAAAALAAERFRLDHNRWPKSFAELVSGNYLDTTPLDPYDAKPMRMRSTIDGLVIYSIGPDKKYDGTALDDLTKYDPATKRIEFRLWNPEFRRQPPLEMKR